MKKICLECYTIEELAKELNLLIHKSHNDPPEVYGTSEKLLSRKEASLYLKISLPTLNTWTKEQRVKSYRIGTRVYYKEGELVGSLNEVNHQKYKQGKTNQSFNN